nr:immunoglobulin heavy chain junction region [Mus musculus]MBK4188716.1 immunoglobulin heavy chain junction region [Mus musculus]
CASPLPGNYRGYFDVW